MLSGTKSILIDNKMVITSFLEGHLHGITFWRNKNDTIDMLVTYYKGDFNGSEIQFIYG